MNEGMVAKLLATHFEEAGAVGCDPTWMANSIKEFRRVCKDWKAAMDRLFRLHISIGVWIGSFEKNLNKYLNFDKLLASKELVGPHVTSMAIMVVTYSRSLWSWMDDTKEVQDEVAMQLDKLTSLFECTPNLESISVNVHFNRTSNGTMLADLSSLIPSSLFKAILTHCPKVKVLWKGNMPQGLIETANWFHPTIKTSMFRKQSTCCYLILTKARFECRFFRKLGSGSDLRSKCAYISFGMQWDTAHPIMTRPLKHTSRLRQVEIHVFEFTHFHVGNFVGSTEHIPTTLHTYERVKSLALIFWPQDLRHPRRAIFPFHNVFPNVASLRLTSHDYIFDDWKFIINGLEYLESLDVSVDKTDTSIQFNCLRNLKSLTIRTNHTIHSALDMLMQQVTTVSTNWKRLVLNLVVNYYDGDIVPEKQEVIEAIQSCLLLPMEPWSSLKTLEIEITCEDVFCTMIFNCHQHKWILVGCYSGEPLFNSCASGVSPERRSEEFCGQ